MDERDSTPTPRTASPREFIARWYRETMISETVLQAAILPLLLPCRGQNRGCCGATVLSARFGRLPSCKYFEDMMGEHYPDPGPAMLDDLLLTAPGWALLLEKLAERVAPPSWFPAWREEWDRRFGEAPKDKPAAAPVPAAAIAPQARSLGKPPVPHKELNAAIDALLTTCGYDPRRYQPRGRRGFTAAIRATIAEELGQDLADDLDRDSLKSRILRRTRRPEPVAARTAAEGALADETATFPAQRLA